MQRKDILHARAGATRRAHRVRSRIRAVSSRPRLCVFRSLRHITVQLIDDTQGKTLAASSDRQVETKGKKPVEIAAAVGADIAQRAKKAGITAVVFDRGSSAYHGRVRALAEAARAEGLEF